MDGSMQPLPYLPIVNPLDLYAIEAGLRIKESEAEVSLVAVSMGPPSAEAALKEAIAMGCDDAILLTGREFSGADTWATARSLSAAIEKLGPVDLVLCGEKATDGDTGQVGPEIAAFLDLPVITYASSLAISKGTVRAERITEDGTELVECELPLVMTFCKGFGEPRLPLLAGKRRAHGISPRQLAPADLGLPLEQLGTKGSPTKVSKIASPELVRKAELIDARGEEGLDRAVGRIIEILRGQRLIAQGAGRKEA